MARVNNFTIKNRGFKEGWLSNTCAECGQGPTWNGKPLTLQLDHINGNNQDNRPENLRILCPNCHTQTDTYGGRKLGRGTVRIGCIGCGFVMQRSRAREERRSRNNENGPFCKPCATKANGAVGLKSRYNIIEVKQAEPVKLICIQCGKDFLRRKAAETFKNKYRKHGPFCSGKCWNEWQKNNPKG